MRDYKSLNVWKKSHALTLQIYDISMSFPNYEIFGVTSQIRRATSSIPTNISEGCGRSSANEFKRFLGIAYGSAAESEYLILLSKDLGYIDEAVYNDLSEKIEEIKKMLSSLIGTINK